MSRSESDPTGAADPLRPADHADSPVGANGVPVGSAPVGPELSGMEWLRWAWRQLTSMRTALVLLLMLAIFAIPGSVWPQRSADPNGVRQYFSDNPDLAKVLDNLQLFDVYTSVWFSAIYILLFISLIGCVIPRTAHHWRAIKARPPRTPSRLSRLPGYQMVRVPISADTAAQQSAMLATATEQLKRVGYRAEQYRDGSKQAGAVVSVSAERGYLRETGNLVFHGALIGVLIAVGVGGGLSYTAQGVIIEGGSIVNQPVDYNSFNPGRFLDESRITPYTLKLDDFEVNYQPYGSPGSGQAGDFLAEMTITPPGGEPTSEQIRVNHPLQIFGDRIFLLGNGYAPTITVRNAEGMAVFSQSVPFLPQDTNLTSVGVIKLPDGFDEQLGLVGFLYPTQVALESGAFTSAYPALVNPVVSLNVFAGDLGIDDGTPRSVYTLDQTGMERLSGGDTGVAPIELAPGETQKLPGGLGTITFEDESPAGATDTAQSVKRFVSLSIHRDPGAVWVLVFAVLAVVGLLLALLVPRRRLWVKITPGRGELQLEYAGLARGDDPGLPNAVAALAARHTAAL